MSLTSDKLSVLDLFSGIGGFSLGLERSGYFETVAFCEVDEFCRKVIEKHWKIPKIFNDINKILEEKPPYVDLICGGFPCQPFSKASRGRKVAVDLWPKMFEVIRYVQPLYVIAENVEYEAISRAERDMQSIGYRTTTRSISAAFAGADHKRDRWWLCAYPDMQSEFRSFFNAEVARLPQLCVGVWGSENYARTIRISDGIPRRLDRSRVEALGNAVLPQIPEVIGRAIGKFNADIQNRP